MKMQLLRGDFWVPKEDFPVSVTVEEAAELLLQACPALGAEQVAVAEADGRVLWQDVAAPESVPPFARSPYDGYALRAEDTASATRQTPVTLEILEEVPAGHAPVHTVGPGQAVKILTGAPIPQGADLVVKFEDTQFTDQEVTLFQPYPSGQNIVPVGEDILAGALAAEGGTRLSPALTGLLAGLGCAELKVFRRPTAALISTGDELVEPDQPLTPGKIRNSSVYALKAWLERLGVQVRLMGIVGDDAQAIAQRVRQAAELADVVITTGGVSVGDYDMVGRAMELLEARVLFWRVKMKPGSAFLASLYGDTPVVSLSGNPASAAVAFFLLGIPLLRKLSGCRDCGLKPIRVRLLEDFPKKSPNRRFVPGRLEIVDGQAALALVPRQGNGMLCPLHHCDLLGEIPAGSPPMKAGDVIDAWQLFNP